MKKIRQMLFASILLFSSTAWAAIDGGYDNGLFIQTPDQKYRLKFNLQLQPQYQFLSIDQQGNTNTFQLRRGKVFFIGNACKKELTYRFELEFISGRTFEVSPSQNSTATTIQDAFLNYQFSDAFKVKVGQFKVFFSKEELVYTSHLQFVDLSLTNEVFSLHRDVGIALHGVFADKKLEYATYIMDDGSNRNATNKNNAFLYGGRLLWNILGQATNEMGDINYSESDITPPLQAGSGGVTHSEHPQLALAVATNFNKVRPLQTAADSKVMASTSDVNFRYHGFSFLGIGYHMRNFNQSTNTFGFLGQAGYFMIPKHLELAARYDGVLPTAVNVSNGYEVGGDLNYYFYGHKLKLQADYNILINSPLTYSANGASGVSLPNNIVTTGGAPGFHSGQKDQQVRLQLQLYF